MRKKHNILSLPSLSFMKRMLMKEQEQVEEEQKDWAKQLAEDPFLSDAMEGLELLRDSPTLSHRLSRIDRKTQQKIKQAGRKRNRAIYGADKKTSFTSWQYMGAAAATFSLLLAVVYMFQILSNEATGEPLLAGQESQEQQDIVPPFLDSTNMYRMAFELVLPPKGLFSWEEETVPVSLPHTFSEDAENQQHSAMGTAQLATVAQAEVSAEPLTHEEVPVRLPSYPYATLYGEIDDDLEELPDVYVQKKETRPAALQEESPHDLGIAYRKKLSKSKEQPHSQTANVSRWEAEENAGRRKGDRDYANIAREEDAILYDRVMSALEAYQNNELVSALEEIEIVLREQADHVAANYYKGLILVELGHSARAVTSFKRALKLVGTGYYREKTLWALANELDKLGQVEQALAVLDKLSLLKGPFRKAARKYKKEIISRSAEKK